MYCDNCGCELADGSQRCPVCGKEFSMIMYNQGGMPGADAGYAGDDSTTVLTSAGISNNDSVTASTDSSEDNDSTTVLTSNREAGDSTTVLTSNSADDDSTTVLTGAGGAPKEVHMSEILISQTNMNGTGGVNKSEGLSYGDAQKNDDKPADDGDVMIKKKGEKKGMSTAAKVALITIPIVIIAAVGLLAYIYVPKFRNYNSANEKFKAGEIEEAVGMYKDLGDFKDSYDKANGGAYYEYAKSLENEARNLEAAEYYKKAAGYNYQDAADKAGQCYYSAGMDQLNAASYDAAIEAFKNAGTYKDATDKITECTYKKAQSLISSESYDEAIELLSSIEDYSDSKTLLSQCYYNKAVKLEGEKNYDEAYEMYMKSEYKDYSDKASETLYTKASELLEAKDYENALSVFEKIDKEYKDCTKEKDKCRSSLGSLSYKAKDYLKALEYFESVEKADVSKKITKCKIAYIKANKDAKNERTMLYAGELRYAGNETAQKLYSELIKWDVKSFVNSDEKDVTTQENKAGGSGDIYIHTSFTGEDGDVMNIKSKVVFSNGQETKEAVNGESVKTGMVTWVKISITNAPRGTAYLYITNVSTDEIIEVYPFTIE